MFTYILWRCLILETFVLGVFCCPCVEEHPQKLFCKSEFVVKAKMREEVTAARDQVFSMEIKKVYKGDVRKLSLIYNRDVLLQIPRRCRDRFMTKNRTYVIFGYSIYGMILVSPTICQKSTAWWRHTLFFAQALKEDNYKDNCDCSHEISYAANDTTKRKHCEWKTSYMMRFEGRCQWGNRITLQRCRGVTVYPPVLK